MFMGISSKPIKRGFKRLIKNWAPPSVKIDSSLLKPGVNSLYATEPLPEDVEFAFPGNAGVVGLPRLNCCLTRTASLHSAAFRYWADCLKQEWRYHRKLWEFCYICQALYERGMLLAGKRGLGFAVGEEPLPAFFASLGCHIMASDLAMDDPRSAPWANTAQWASDLEALNRLGICPEETFRELVRFCPVDMNKIPANLTGFDFTWSSCSFEHCGNLELGKQFLLRQMDCLAPGGIAVHTTEFNLSSDKDTLDEGMTVIFRRRDIEEMVQSLRLAGHDVEPLDLSIGKHAMDQYIDHEPHCFKRHLRLKLGDWASTSIGLIIRKRL